MVSSQSIATALILPFVVTSRVTFLNFRATSMARSGVAPMVWACYLVLIEPPLRCFCISLEVSYEACSSVLRGVGVRGGSLDF